MRRSFPFSVTICPLVIALLLGCSTVVAQTMGASDATVGWTASKSSPCTLTHLIHGFGRAVVSHGQVGGSSLHLDADDNIFFPVGTTTIETIPPVWRSDLIPVRIGTTTATSGNRPVKLDSTLTRQLLAQLVAGNGIIFMPQANEINGFSRSFSRTNVGASSGTSEEAAKMRVMLDAKNFASAYKNYQLCTGEHQTAQNSVSSGSDAKKSQIVTSDAERVASYIKRDAGQYGTSVNRSSVNQSSVNQSRTSQSPVSNSGPSYVVASRLSSAANIQTFGTDVSNADWKNIGSRFSCELTHPISGFGKASFTRKGDGESFIIETEDKIQLNPGLMQIETFPPVWRHDVVPINLGESEITANARQITLNNASQLEKIVTHLVSGTRVVFTSSSAAGVTRVVLEAKNFSSSYKSYQQCVKQLIPYTFAQVARTVINYPEKTEGLSNAAKAELVKVARYSTADNRVLGLLIDAHSDNTGAAENNIAVSKQHAEWVTAYLIEQGVPATRITTRWHADKYPVVDNKTAESRARNRRVTVRLETAESRQEIAKKIAEIKLAAEKEEENKMQIAKDEVAKASLSDVKNLTDSENKTEKDSPSAKTESVEKQASDESTHSNKTKSSEASSSSKGKLTPEDIKKLVEGLDLIDS
ncbi:MAG: OmpA family protein [Chitinophagaceae bacterium]|nr:MAG: OmpA family protein [Chitinophagaceae bacterium]